MESRLFHLRETLFYGSIKGYFGLLAEKGRGLDLYRTASRKYSMMRRDAIGPSMARGNSFVYTMFIYNDLNYS